MLALEEYEKLNPHTALHFGGLAVACVTPNSFAKEPIPLEWIAGFNTNDVLIDVGANVAMYTIWATKTQGAQALAFEPQLDFESLKFIGMTPWETSR